MSAKAWIGFGITIGIARALPFGHMVGRRHADPPDAVPGRGEPADDTIHRNLWQGQGGCVEGSAQPLSIGKSSVSSPMLLRSRAVAGRRRGMPGGFSLDFRLPRRR